MKGRTFKAHGWHLFKVEPDDGYWYLRCLSEKGARLVVRLDIKPPEAASLISKLGTVVSEGIKSERRQHSFWRRKLSDALSIADLAINDGGQP